MTPVVPSISHKMSKDLINFYAYLKNKNHHAVKVPSQNDKPSIIVIGSGISGIAAAKELTSHGFNVLLIEARDRIGGRVHSVELGKGQFIELGAQYIHGIKNNPLFNISENYQLEVKPYTRSDWAIYDIDGNEIDKNQLSEIVDEYKHLLSSLSLERKSDNKDRFLVEDMKELDIKLLRHKATKESDLHALAKMISIKEYNEEKLFQYKLGVVKKESESNYLVTNGYSKLLQGLLNDAMQTGLLKVLLSTQVSKIQHTSENISVHTKKDEVFQADAVICTVPLGVLKAGTLMFDPPLPKLKTKAINNLNMAIHNKVVLEFEDVFWDKSLSHFVVLYDPTLNAWLDIINLQFFHTQKMPILLSSIYSGNNAKINTDKYMLNHFVNLLKRIYPDTYRPLKQHWITDWGNDPYSLGSYSYHPEGSGLDDNSEIAKPMGRVIFAGEHTHRSPSNIQGAYLSGLEGAVQVVEQLHNIYEMAAHDS